MASDSTHPDFPNGMEVINISPRSVYFGQRGVVYGSGPSKSNSSSQAIIWVAWPNGERCSYFPSRLVHPPLAEAKYKVTSRTNAGKKITIHEIPATKRPCPTIFELVEKQKTKAAS